MARTTGKTRRTPATKSARTRATAAKASAKASTAKPARKEITSKTTPETTRKSPERRTHAEKIKLGKSIIARQNKGETANEIATDLHLYPFQVHQLIQLVHVDKGDVPAITAKSEDVLVKKLAAARAKGDKFASWDWLQARSGINKVRIQKLLGDAGVDTGDVRAARKGTPKRSRPARTADRSKASKATETMRTRNRQQSAPKRTRKLAAATPAVKPVSKRRAAANSAKVKAAGKSKAAAPVAMAKVAKPKPKRKPLVAKGQTSKPATRTPAQRRARRPVNVPKGARPTADPS